jgi:hypothetical protein
LGRFTPDPGARGVDSSLALRYPWLSELGYHTRDGRQPQNLPPFPFRTPLRPSLFPPPWPPILAQGAGASSPYPESLRVLPDASTVRWRPKDRTIALKRVSINPCTTPSCPCDPLASSHTGLRPVPGNPKGSSALAGALKRAGGLFTPPPVVWTTRLGRPVDPRRAWNQWPPSLPPSPQGPLRAALKLASGPAPSLVWVAPGCRIPFQMASARAETPSRAPPCPRARPSCPWDRGKGAPAAGVPKAPRGPTPSKSGEGPRLAPGLPVLASLGGKNLLTPAGRGKARAPGSQGGVSLTAY